MSWLRQPGPARVYVLAALLGAVEIAIFIWGLPTQLTSVSLDQLPYALLLALAIMLMRRYHIGLVVMNRRISQHFGEVLMVIGLFHLDPGWVVLARLAGQFGAEFVMVPGLHNHWRWFNVANISLQTTLTVLAVVHIHPSSALDQPLALAVPLLVWLVGDALCCTMVPLMYWLEFGGRKRMSPLDLLRLTFVPLFSAGLGMIIAALIEVSPWLLLPMGFLAAVLLAGAQASLRVQALSNAMEQSLAFNKACHHAADRNAVLAALLPCVMGLGGAASVHIVRRDGDVLQWDTPLPRKLADALPNAAALDALLQSGPANCGKVGWAVGAWQLLPDGTDLVVTTNRRLARTSDLWDAISKMVTRADLAVDKALRTAELKRLGEAEYRRARTDALTDLPNSFAARQHLQQLLDQPRTQDFSVLLCVVDDLKQIIDVLGMAAGDETIKAVAQRLAGLAGVDFVARTATNEFLLLMPGDAAAAQAVARQIAMPQAVGDDRLGERSMALGIACVTPGQATTVDEVLAQADLALQKSQHAEVPVVFGAPFAAEASRRLAVRLALPAAVRRERVTPFFQPQIDLASGKLVGLEVLARWTDPQLGRVGPDEFIPIAEQSGQVEALTRSLVEQTLCTRRRWIDEGRAVPSMSINLCARSLGRPDFMAGLLADVSRHGAAAQNLTMEITESTLAVGLTEALGRLHETGARISIDDFGTGYSALAYLHQLPLDEVKIDKSMVMTLDRPGRAMSIITGILHICRGLGLQVVAEGVETDAVRQRLVQLGADIGQGYLFAKPLSALEVAPWMPVQDSPRMQGVSLLH